MKRATYEDVLNAPENKVAEILDGELFLSPMLAPRDCVVHSGLLGLLGCALDDGDRARGGWWILPKPEVHLGEDVVVPDIGGWRRADVPILPDAYFSVPPTWLCEVLAPTTERFDRSRELRIYAAAGRRPRVARHARLPHARSAAPSRWRVDDPRRVGGRGRRPG